MNYNDPLLSKHAVAREQYRWGLEKVNIVWSLTLGLLLALIAHWQMTEFVYADKSDGYVLWSQLMSGVAGIFTSGFAYLLTDTLYIINKVRQWCDKAHEARRMGNELPRN